ncbi:HD domain-containing protein [Desulfosporosinus sp.]|uniref:HD domain-containing protein n=1 Tax=Desulfosporosinus sp. TaxID=157907 RepID=UPI00231D3871|nr:HD domain-containing protein [Desulfosporosinus sp.]MDA8221707.1 HD domain-containing protein [Desulfitobacterium hafniense]
MFYRVHQFICAVFPHLNQTDIDWAIDHLSPEASKLFLRQSKPEQRHAIDVAKSIVNANNPISFHEFQDLITAALLHDCGKSVASIRLWQRVYIVLMNKMPNFLWSNLERGPSIFSIPLKVYERHALWGGYLAKKAGLNSVVCLLIREHHTPTTDLGRILEQADNMS